MSHAAEGSLQAYLDGELDGAATTALREHLASCDVCADELSELRSLDERAHGAFALMDAPPPMLRAQALIAARAEGRRDQTRRLIGAGSFGMTKAAMLLLALAGAGAAIIPGSPLRDALETVFARVFRRGAEPVAPAVQQPVDGATAVTMQSFGVAPEQDRVQIILRAPSGDVIVRVRSTDDGLARIESAQPTPISLRTAPNGRAELRNIANSTVTISIPRSVQHATIEIDDVVYVAKQNGTLRQVQSSEGSRVRVEIED